MKTVFQTTLFAAALLSAATLVRADLWFVTTAGTGSGQPNWANAGSLQTALAGAVAGDEIWVAQGTYVPTVQYCVSCPSTTARHATFRIFPGQQIYGGFRGPDDSDPNNPFPGETSRNDRNEDLYVTTLSGDLNGDDEPAFLNRSDNAYHIVTALNVTESTKLSGFTIYGGEAKDPNTPDVYERSGGGLLVVGTGEQQSSLWVTRCRFEENRAWEQGGGAAVLWDGIPSDPEDFLPARFVNNTFYFNFSEPPNPETAGGNGAGLAVNTAVFEVTNCIFDNNVAIHLGAGVYANGLEGHEPQGILTNNTFAAQKALTGYALAVESAATPNSPAVFLNNSICWDSTSNHLENIYGYVDVSYSDVSDPLIGFLWPSISYPNSNINVDPLFCSPGTHNWGLLQGSPCVDLGLDFLVVPDNADVNENGTIETKIPWDRIKSERQVDAITGNEFVDMGAIESPHYNDCPWDFDRDGDIDFQDLAYFLSQYSLSGCPCLAADFDCSGTVGIEDLAEFLSHFATTCQGGGGGGGFAGGGENSMGGDNSDAALIEWLRTATPEDVIAWWEAGMPPIGGGNW